MTKQYRVIETQEVINSYVIEVPDDADLDELTNTGDWEKHVLFPVYENDATDECGVLEIIETNKTVSVEDGYIIADDDGEIVWTRY